MEKSIIYCSPYVPPEWIAAHGFLPRRIMPAGSETVSTHLPSMGVCPYAAAFTATCAREQNASAVVVTASCDQMRRMAGFMEKLAICPVFTMHVPTSMHAFALYQDELRRLGKFLQRLGGETPSQTDLAEQMLRFETARTKLKEAQKRLAPQTFNQRLMRFHAGDWTAIEDCEERWRAKGIPIVLAGSPLTQNTSILFELVTKAGGYVALDATTTGERTLPSAFNALACKNDPFTELAQVYFHSITDAFRRPNDALYAWLQTRLIERNARGIIMFHYVWCDTWQVEVQRMRERLQLPVIAIDAAEHETTRMAGRIAAFMEALL